MNFIFKCHNFFLPLEFCCVFTAGSFLADGSGAIGINKYVVIDLVLNRIEKALVTTGTIPVITEICSTRFHVNLGLSMVNTHW